MATDRLAPAAAGFSIVARRISSWTTKGLLTAIVLLAGLGFGRQTLKWWAADASPPGNPVVGLAADVLGDPRQPATIQFGDHRWSLCRRSITGDKNKAVEQLRAACREVLRAGPAAAQTPPAEEERFLALLGDATPVDQEPGRWRLYEFHAMFPMAVGLARPAQIVRQPRLPAGGNLAQAGYRVVTWAIAVPAAEAQWTLCTFRPSLPSTAGSAAIDVPLPPGTQRTLFVEAGGGRTVALSGPDRPERWKRFYQDWFARRGWPAASWRSLGAAWNGRFAAPDGGGSVDIHFGPDGRGGLSGLLLVTPANRGKQL
jgi:hypothetical protein